jgi:PAS domain S-box-containing protein
MEITHKRRHRLQAVAVQFLLGIAGLVLITFACFQLGAGVARTGFVYVILVALVSLLGSFSASVVLSVLAAACLNYFFAPPLFDLRIDLPEDIERIAAFLTTSLVVTALTTKLRASEQRFRSFVDHATDAFFLLDEDWTIVDVNRQACESLGYSRDELIGKHKSDFDVGLDDASIQRLKQRMVAGEAVTFETRHRRKDGTSFPVEVRVGQFEQDGRRFLCLVRDITKRKQADDALRDSEERFRTLVQFSFDVYWESDAQHRFTRQVFAEGLADAPAPGSEIGKTRWEMPYLEPDEEAWRKHRETLDAHLPFRDFELARPTPDGGKRYVSVSGLPVFDRTGRLTGYRGVGRHITARKLIEVSLRERERELREILETIPAMTVTVLPDGSNVFIGKRFSEYSGLSEEEGQGSGWKGSVHPDDLDLHMHKWRASLTSGDPIEVETRFRRADGEYRWFLARAAPLRDELGNILKWYEVLTDIEDRKRAEERSRESQTKLEAAQRIAHVGWWQRDLTTGHVGLSDEVCRIFGVQPLELPQWHERWLKLIHPEDRPRAAAAAAAALLPNGPRYDVEYRVVRPDGNVRIIHSQGDVTWDETERPLRQFGVLQDITELRWAEEQLRASEEALRRREAYLAEAQRLSHTGTLAFNATSPVYWSEESYRIWGLDPLRGLPDRETVLQRIHPDDRERVNAETDEALRQKRDFTLEFRIVLTNGTVKYIESTGRPFFSADGELVEIVATHVDVTERKRAQEEHERLRQLETDIAHLNRVSMMGELAASLAHEILHPIATARNNARAGMRFLERSPPDLGEVREALACVVRDADRAKDIVGRMRDHIKKAPARRELFDLNEAINEVIVTVRSAMATSRVSVRTRLLELTPVLGDRVQLQQVIMNLVLNAVEAMSAVEDGARELSIEAEQSRTNGGVLVAVRDSGPGIDPERLEQVFEPFYTTKSSGMGMGLSICRSIVAAHAGRLWAEANQPRGTVFHLTLPSGSDDS